MGLEALFQGWQGELQSKVSQWLFLNSEYHFFNNVILRLENGSTQIDHIVVSKFGVFVVETKKMRGWIFGNEHQDEWTQSIYGHKTKFQNPLRQNYKHTKSLADSLGIDHNKIFSLIVFWGDCKFKTKMPDKVLNNRYTSYIKSKREVLFDDFEVGIICRKIKDIKDSTSIFSGREHVPNLKETHQVNSNCPKCGGHLLERIARREDKAGRKFLGCENFPKCHYIKDMDEDKL